MDLHKNARSCPASRALLVERVRKQGWAVWKAAQAAGMSERRAYVWLSRARGEPTGGFCDRSSAPRRYPRQKSLKLVRQAVELRHERRSASEIAQMLGVPRSTVARWLHAQGLGRLNRLAPPEPARRYQKARAGELLHLDIKQLGVIRRIGHRITGNRRHRCRGAGWEYVHVAIDDASRVAYAEVLPDQRAPTAIAFLRRALAFFAARGILVEALLSDNGSCYRSRLFAAACRELGLVHHYTRPYRPRTNGKAERFIQTIQREWAYAFPFPTSAARTQLLSRYLHFYNCHRAHASLGGRPPISCMNNVVRIDI
jgi:transposase InsO family protein